MEILINDHLAITELQEKFNQVFPYLKIEILEPPIEKGRSIKGKSTLGKYRNGQSSNENIVISSKQKVRELKQLFEKVYGLIVLIFRKIGEIWLETTSTIDWTFEKQNNEAVKLNTFS
jgi:hypothetical protein